MLVKSKKDLSSCRGLCENINIESHNKMSTSLDWWVRTNEHTIAQIKLVPNRLRAMKNLFEDETIVLMKPLSIRRALHMVSLVVLICVKFGNLMVCHWKRRGGDSAMTFPNILNVSSQRFIENFQGAKKRLQQILFLH